jgi:hypothetical protein
VQRTFFPRASVERPLRRIAVPQQRRDYTHGKRYRPLNQNSGDFFFDARGISTREWKRIVIRTSNLRDATVFRTGTQRAEPPKAAPLEFFSEPQCFA